MSDTDGCAAIIIFAMCAFFLGYLAGYGKCSSSWEKEAVRREYAYYHPQTSEFTWKETTND